MARKVIYETIWDKIQRIIPGIETKPAGYACKLKADGFMDLHIDVLERSENGRVRISLAHRYVQNGDSMADPDMEVSLIPSMKMAEALTYQQDGLGIYQVVYPEPGKFYPKLKKDLNAFLNRWMSNVLAQGHRIDTTTTANDEAA